MNKQDIFNMVALHLLNQGEKSFDYGCCAYRGKHGRKCAIGCLISDEEYFMDMEGMFGNLASLKDRYPQLEIFSQPDNWEILISLQRVHDCYDPNKWEDALQKVAREYNLIFPSQN